MIKEGDVIGGFSVLYHAKPGTVVNPKYGQRYWVAACTCCNHLTTVSTRDLRGNKALCENPKCDAHAIRMMELTKTNQDDLKLTAVNPKSGVYETLTPEEWAALLDGDFATTAKAIRQRVWAKKSGRTNYDEGADDDTEVVFGRRRTAKVVRTASQEPPPAPTYQVQVRNLLNGTLQMLESHLLRLAPEEREKAPENPSYSNLKISRIELTPGVFFEDLANASLRQALKSLGDWMEKQGVELPVEES